MRLEHEGWRQLSALAEKQSIGSLLHVADDAGAFLQPVGPETKLERF